MAASRTLPLEGIRILDLTHDWAGPHATRVLADFGAEVIKIEYAGRMDGMRGGLKENQAYNHHARWYQINRNKLSVTLDLKRPKDVGICKDLVGVSDVVVESSRVGVMEGFGLGSDTLREINPRLIVVCMSGFGRTGPEAAYAGYGGCMEALSGVQCLTAYAAGERPTRIREMDVTNGIVGACAIMTALIHRQRTGSGQFIDLSQMEAATSSLIGASLLGFAMSGVQPLPAGNRSERRAPQGCYRCAGEDKWVALAIRSDAEWARLCDEIGRPDLQADARFATHALRAASHDAIDQIIEAWTSSRAHTDVMARLQAAGLAAGAVLNAADLAADPHLQQRGFFQQAEDGSGMFPGLPFRLSETPGRVRLRGPFLGEHNEQIITGLLGRPASDVDPIAEDQIGTAFEIE